ncbi:hypothetical protein [Paraburkholderia sediminicola]|uniref:hypothetical protein n=1 Tax=Paraburkholderia sediminicola TaxID=458836 RepID=UPI0038BD5942
MPKKSQLTVPSALPAASLFWSIFHAAWGLDREEPNYNKDAWMHVHLTLLSAVGTQLESPLLAHALRNAPASIQRALAAPHELLK